MGKSRVMFHHKWRWQRVTKLMARDGLNCTICGEVLDRKVKEPGHPKYITFDHIKPCSEGGLTLLHNLRLAHRQCNQDRGVDPIMPESEKPGAAEIGSTSSAEV